MINEPSVDALIRKLGTEEEPASPLRAVRGGCKAHRQIIEQMQAAGITELPGKQKEIVLACPGDHERKGHGIARLMWTVSVHKGAPGCSRGFFCISEKDMICEVIVDIAHSEVDKIFDYVCDVPVQAGARVAVRSDAARRRGLSFGSRKQATIPPIS